MKGKTQRTEAKRAASRARTMARVQAGNTAAIMTVEHMVKMEPRVIGEGEKAKPTALNLGNPRL